MTDRSFQRRLGVRLNDELENSMNLNPDSYRDSKWRLKNDEGHFHHHAKNKCYNFYNIQPFCFKPSGLAYRGQRL